MKRLINYVTTLFTKQSEADPIQSFFKGSEAEKRPLYEEALRAAQKDQQRVLDKVAAL